jgi:DNA-binding NtrC family response regulator
MKPSSTCGIIHIASANSRGRVLIVDDEPLVRWSLAAALNAAGFEAVTAACGTDAVARVGAGPAVAVVIIDLELYATDCLALVDSILAASPACRVLALTTAGTETPMRASWTAVPHIRKPFDVADVVRLVETELAQVSCATGML